MAAALKNDLLIRALLREPVPRTPVWIMRQAGRYLPEYRAVREKAGDFMSVCSNPELACEVTLQPLRRFQLDAAILFSDILTIPDALGLGLYFETGEGPKFRNPVSTESEIKNLAVPDVTDKLGYVFDAVTLIRRELNGQVPLIGFAGSPWTVGTYMVEGGSSREFAKIKGLAAENPALLEHMLDVVAATTTDYLNAQIDAGAQAIMIFDTWGAALELDDYRRFSLAGMQRIVDGLQREKDGSRIPVILFTKGAGGARFPPPRSRLRRTAWRSTSGECCGSRSAMVPAWCASIRRPAGRSGGSISHVLRPPPVPSAVRNWRSST